MYDQRIPYFATFGGVEVGEPLLYLNSLSNVALALNQGSFVAKHGIRSGAEWNIAISRGGGAQGEE